MKKKNNISFKRQLRINRKRHIRKNIFGSQNIPRISIFRSIKHIFVQAINDYKSSTIESLGTFSKKIKYIIRNKKRSFQAYIIGRYFGKILYRKGIRRIAIDRNGFKYIGRIKYLIDGLRLSGLHV